MLVIHDDRVICKHVHLIATTVGVVLLAIVSGKLVFVLKELILVTLRST